ncbi:MAG: hypothetical protein ACE5G2_11305 [Candidatus Krumholzibacteriia bacterium]
MRRRMLVLGLLALGLALPGCGGRKGALQHPITNELDPVYDTMNIRTLAALPFASDVGDDDDPDRIAAQMVQSKFYAALGLDTGFTVLPASEVERVVESAGLKPMMDDFYKDWISDQEDVDEEFVRAVAERLEVQAVVGGAVDVWYQEEVDLTESGTARTHVGVLIGVFDGSTGKRLWLARDENSQDALRYPGPGAISAQELQRGVERSNRRTAGGVYAPPDFSDVVDILVGALVDAFPPSAP